MKHRPFILAALIASTTLADSADAESVPGSAVVAMARVGTVVVELATVAALLVDTPRAGVAVLVDCPTKGGVGPLTERVSCCGDRGTACCQREDEECSGKVAHDRELVIGTASANFSDFCCRITLPRGE